MARICDSFDTLVYSSFILIYLSSKSLCFKHVIFIGFQSIAYVIITQETGKLKSFFSLGTSYAISIGILAFVV